MRFHLFICLFVLTGLRLFAQSGTLVTEGKPATASTYEGAFAPSNTNDGDINTRWASEWNENEWWQVDLAEPMSISSVVIQWEGAYATAYEIQISDDPAFITYEVIATVTNSDGGEDIVTTNSTPQGQYLRMQGVTRALEAYGYSIFEFKAYHSESNPNSEIEVYLHIPFNAQYYSLGITPEDNTGQSTFIAQNEAIDATLYYDAGTTISLSNINITGDYDIRFNTQDETGNPVSSTADPFVTDIYDGMSINIEYVPHEEGGANKLPVADAGVDQIIYTPENSIQLDGSNSYDPDGFIFEHLWSQINGPSTAILSDPDSPQTFANDLTLGTYNFELKVTDDLGAIHTDRVNVTVTEPESSDFSLISPADGALITNSRTPVLEWESLPAATNYEIFLNITRDDYDWYASGNLLDRYTKIGESTTNSFTVPDNLVDRWTYKWYVIANTSEGIKKSNTMQFGLYLPYLENVNDGVSIVDGSRDMNKNGTIEPFENWKLTPEERLDDIMSRLTLEEKASQLFYGGNENPLDGFAFSYGVERNN
jgi:beta-glucosidase